MKLGLIHYNAPGDTLEEFLDYAAESGFKYLELGARDAWPEGDEQPEKRTEAVAKMLAARGMQASTLQAGNDFIQLKADGLAGEVARMKRCAGLAKILGTDLLRIDAGWPRTETPEASWMAAVVEGLKRCMDWADETDTRFALDNHGIVTNTAGFQLEVWAQVNSPRLGFNLDTMNYRWFGNDLGAIDRYYELVAPYVFHVHLKDGTGSRGEYKGAALGEGEINLTHAAACLRRANYQGVFCAEYEGPRDTSAEGYRKCLAWMKANLKD
jgi:sugar phosphate isomerase/epimerase